MERPAKHDRASINEISKRIYGRELADADAAAVAGLINALSAEIDSCRRMSAGNDEPATVYFAVEGAP